MYHEDEEYYNANEVDSDSDSETFFSEVSIQKRAKRIQEEYKMNDPDFAGSICVLGTRIKLNVTKPVTRTAHLSAMQSLAFATIIALVQTTNNFITRYSLHAREVPIATAGICIMKIPKECSSISRPKSNQK